MAHWCRRLLGALGVLLAVSPASAADGEGRVSLRWSAPEECPDDVQLVHAVEALLGESLLDAGEQGLVVHAVVSGDATGYSAGLHFSSAQGEEDRQLAHPSCDKLVQAVALVVALTIDPERVRATQTAREAAPQAGSTPPVAAVPVAVAAQPMSRLPKPAGSLHQARKTPLSGLRFALHGDLGAGSLPNFGAGVDAVLGWHRREFRAEIVTRYWATRRQDIRLAPNAALDLQLATLGARVCWQPQLSVSWRVAACGGADVGGLHGDGVGLENQQSRDARSTDLAAGMEVAYARGHLMPEAGVEFLGALERPSFGIKQNGVGSPEFRPAAWGFVMFLGVSFEL